MDTSLLAALAGMGMAAMLVMIVGGTLLAALVLCVAFRLVVGYLPSYPRSIGAVLLAAVAALAVSVVLRTLLPQGPSGLLTLLAEFLVGAVVVDHLLLAQNGGRIGFGKACAVQLVYLMVGFVLAMVVGAVFAVLFGSMLATMH